MKQISSEPMIAIIFKAFAIVTLLGGLAMVLFQGVYGLPALIYGGFVAAPALWWMGEVISLLGRIAANGEKSVQRPETEPPRRAAATQATPAVSAKSLMRSVAGGETDPPSYKL